MKCLKATVMIMALLFVSLSGYVNAEARMQFLEAKSASEERWKNKVQHSSEIESVVAFMNDHFRLDKELIFLFGADDGPLFDPDINTIFFPYSFFEEVEERFVNASYEETGVTAEDATMRAVVHTFFHEFAHALVHFYELPILGKEEDAADSFATVYLTEFFDDGQFTSLTAADLFELESQDVEKHEAEDYAGEHSLDIQRYYAILCQVYGSDAEKFAEFVTEGYLEKERAETCIFEYETAVKNWFSVLKPFTR